MRKYLDKKYEMGGRGPDAFDCYGLCQVIYKEKNGVILPQLWTPINAKDKNELFQEQSNALCCRLEKQRAWCIIAFCFYPEWVTHLGIVVDDVNKFIHIMRHRTVSIERFDVDPWSRKVEGFYEVITNRNN